MVHGKGIGAGSALLLETANAGNCAWQSQGKKGGPGTVNTQFIGCALCQLDRLNGQGGEKSHRLSLIAPSRATLLPTPQWSCPTSMDSSGAALPKPSGGPEKYEDDPELYDTGQSPIVVNTFELIVSDHAQAVWCGLGRFRHLLLSRSVRETSLLPQRVACMAFTLAG